MICRTVHMTHIGIILQMHTHKIWNGIWIGIGSSSTKRYVAKNPYLFVISELSRTWYFHFKIDYQITGEYISCAIHYHSMFRFQIAEHNVAVLCMYIFEWVGFDFHRKNYTTQKTFTYICVTFVSVWYNLPGCFCVQSIINESTPRAYIQCNVQIYTRWNFKHVQKIEKQIQTTKLFIPVRKLSWIILDPLSLYACITHTNTSSV